MGASLRTRALVSPRRAGVGVKLWASGADPLSGTGVFQLCDPTPGVYTLKGELDISGALVVDADTLDHEALREAHAQGRPVVVRAATAVEVKAALARPEVALALVTDPALLDLDLTELTYG